MKAKQLAKNLWQVKTSSYEINVDTAAARAAVIVDGCEAAGLDLRSAVNTLDELNHVIIDAEPNVPRFVGISEQGGECVFRFENTSSLWQKEYVLCCTPLRFCYAVSVSGEGAVDSVNYFSGDIACVGHGSQHEFAEGFYPLTPWKPEDSCFFKPWQSNKRWNVLMVPPMFCYSFRMSGISRRLALGLCARRGEHNFNSFDYNSCKNGRGGGFFLSTDQSGHTHVSGKWSAPEVIGYAASDDMDALRRYSDYYFTAGLAPRKPQTTPPRFWQGPMACGWIEQCLKAASMDMREASALCRQDFYEEYCLNLKKHDLHPTALIIDDKWQAEYATAQVDIERWPDMRGFIDRRHAEGIKTILWFKLWDSEGWDKELCLTDSKGSVRIDPSHPKFIAMLKDTIHRLLSSDAGCLDADGFKLDFAFIIPMGHSVKTYSGKYGCELMYDYMKLIYDTAKAVKPDALINCSPCHPYFANVCDQARLHDYDERRRDCTDDMTRRAEIFAIANPHTLLDTDNAGFDTRRDTMRWLLRQGEVGVPDLYALSGGDLTDDDLEELAAYWREYSARIDAQR